MRRVHLKGRENILKRLLIHAAGFNLALVMRKMLGVGKPRGLQGRNGACSGLRFGLRSVWECLRPWVAALGSPLNAPFVLARRPIRSRATA